MERGDVGEQSSSSLACAHPKEEEDA